MNLNQNINTFDFNAVIDSGYYLNAKQLFYSLNKQIPMYYNIHPFDYEKGLKYFQKEASFEVENIYTKYNMDRNERKSKYELNYAVIVLKNKTVIHIGSSFCSICALPEHNEYILAMSNTLKKFKRRERKKEFELNLISFDNNYFSLK